MVKRADSGIWTVGKRLHIFPPFTFWYDNILKLKKDNVDFSPSDDTLSCHRRGGKPSPLSHAQYRIDGRIFIMLYSTTLVSSLTTEMACSQICGRDDQMTVHMVNFHQIVY